MATETYISIDIEADGPIPGPYSMLSLGAAAFESGVDAEKPFSTFTANLELLEGASQDHDTMLFWARNEKAYQATRVEPEDPGDAMDRFATWLEKFRRPVFVGYPATYDFMFVYWYLIRFAGRCPAGFQGLDLKTYAMAILGTSFKESSKKRYPKEWFDPDIPHTHVALADAIEQGRMFAKMRQWRRDYKGG